MATPSIGDLILIGASGGQAPHPSHVYVDVDEEGTTWSTGSGGWTEGRWAFQLIDDATDTIYDSGLMDLTCPITGITASAYNRYGAVPIAGCVVFDPGTYHWRVKYQNRDGDWSEWSNSASFTVASNTRTKVYVDGTNGNDSNDGTSWGSAKKTLNGGLSLVDGDDYEVILKDDTTIDNNADNNLLSRSGIWLRRSGDGTNKPIVVAKAAYLIQCGNDTVVDGIEVEYDGVQHYDILGTGSNISNIAWMNIDTHEINAFAEMPSGTAVEGIVVYGCRMMEYVRRYMIFAGGPRVINVLGCVWDKGSTVEHLIRTGWNLNSDGSEPSPLPEFISVDFTILDQANRSKTTFRNYSKRFSGAYRTDFRRGSFSVGDIDVTGVDLDENNVPIAPTERYGPYRYDCCRFYFEDAISHPQAITIHEAAKDVVFAACNVYQLSGNCVNFNWRSSGNDDPIENVKFIGCSFFNGGNQSNSITVNNTISNENLLDINFRGCIFMGTEQAYPLHYIAIINMKTGLPDNSGTGVLFLDENVFLEADYLNPAIFNGDLRILGDGETSTNWYDIALLNAESFADGNILEILTIDPDTGEPTGSTTQWQTTLTDISGLFESINGEVYDRSNSTWAAGAWQPVGSGTGEVAGYFTDGAEPPVQPPVDPPSEPNNAPVWQNIPSQRVTEGQTLDIDLSNYVSDVDGDTLTYGFTGPVWIKPTDATPRPEETWAGISGSILTLTPQVGDARSYGITAEVSDGTTTVNKFFYVLVDPATQWVRDEDGWTILNPTTGSADPADDSRMIYVSNNGSDSNDGLSPQTPKLTVQAAYNLARNNYPDWVHLERGGTYDFNVISWSKDGKSLSEAQVITAYGEGPMPVVTNKITIGGAMRNNLVVRDIHILQADNSADSGISMLSGGSNFLIEGCKIENTADGFNISFNPKTNVQIRRNIVTKSFPRPVNVFNSGARASNMFANSIDGFLIEENLFHAGGHSGNRVEATIFSHGLYLETGLRNQIIRRNTLIDASSNAISNNGEGDMYENLILRGAIGIFMRAAPASAYDNVILYGADINSPQSINRGFGIIVADRWKGPGGPGIIQRNLIAHNDSVGKREAIVIEDYVNAEAEPFGVTIDSNVIVNWEANSLGQLWVEGNDATDYTSINVTNNIFDASGLTSYMVYLSEDNSPLPDAYLFDGNSYISAKNESEWFRDAGGNVSLSEWISNEEATAATWDSGFTNRGAGVDEYMVANSLGTDVDDFLAGALQNNRLSWNTAYTARPVIDYVRAAHDMPVLPPVSYVEESPVTGELALIGASGGQAPYPSHVYADVEEEGTTWSTGSGGWSEGRWAFQLIDEDSNTIYDSGLMDLTCPISGVTASAYNRYGAVPVAGCVVFDPGTYHWRVKYQNKLGIWSDWVDSASFTVASNTRTKVYIDGTNGNDSNDGSSWGSAKKTLNGGLSLVDGDDYEVILADDTTIDCNNSSNLDTHTGVWIHRSGNGTNKPIVTLKQTGQAIIMDSDCVVDGIEFEYDGVTRRNVFNFADADTNCAVLNIDTNEISSFAEISSQKNYDGFIIYNCKMLETCQRYMLFTAGGYRINVLGCDWQKHSVDEHLIRIVWKDQATDLISEFVSVDFCKLDQEGLSNGKNSLRLYTKRFAGGYRSKFSGGKFEVGNIDAAGDSYETFSHVRFDCCVIDFVGPGTAAQNVNIFEGTTDCVFASCLFYRNLPTLSSLLIPCNRSSGGVAVIDGLKIIGCTMYMAGNVSVSSTPGHIRVPLTEDMTNFELRGSQLQFADAHINSSNKGQNFTSQAGPPAGYSLIENVWYDTHPTYSHRIFNDTSVSIETASLLNNESFASGNVGENLSIDASTGEPSGGTAYLSAVTDITGLFETLNGEVIDRTNSAWPAGAWHPVGSGINEPAGYSPDTVGEVEPNNAPTWTSIPSQELNEGQIATVDLSSYASDADEGDSLTFSLVNPPSWVTIAGPVVTIAPQDGDEGLYTITARASDGTAATNTTFNVLVNRIPTPGNTGAASFIVVIG